MTNEATTVFAVAVVALSLVAGSAVRARGGRFARAGFRGRNGLIAFVRERSPNALGGYIFVMNPNGSAQRLLTSNTHDDDPAWSPNWRDIAFTRNADIYIMAANGSHLRRLTTLRGDFASSPTWSPDGRRIVFQRGRYGNLWVMKADGSGARLLAKPARGVGPYDYTGTRWSPDGKELLFYATSANGSDQIVVMGANGGGRRALTSGPASHESPDWSPDGKRIVFVGPAPQSESEPPGGGGIYVMKSNGSGQRWLKTVGDSPVWSPDGSKILFGRGNPQSNSEQLYVGNTDGSDIKRLTTGHADFGSAWQPRPAKT